MTPEQKREQVEAVAEKIRSILQENNLLGSWVIVHQDVETVGGIVGLQKGADWTPIYLQDVKMKHAGTMFSKALPEKQKAYLCALSAIVKGSMVAIEHAESERQYFENFKVNNEG